MTYVVSLIILGDEKTEHKTVVHHEDFNVAQLLPSNELVPTELHQVVPEWVRLKRHLKTAQLFLNDKLYHIFHEHLSPDYTLKHMQVLTKRFKPQNKFEEFLVEHGLIEKSLEGVKVEFSSENNEYSKSFGPRTFHNRGTHLYKLHEEHRISQYYRPHVNHVSGNDFRYTTTTKILSVEGKPWLYEQPKPITPKVPIDEARDDEYCGSFLINEYQDL